MTENRLDEIRARIAPLRRSLIEHPIYERIGSVEAVRRFMEYHVFAVWDFMSLLKALQRKVCCVEVPWTPPKNPAACRLVNEIVLGEESDRGQDGVPCSHFELYLRAMADCGAATGPIDRLIAEIKGGRDVASAVESAGLPRAVGRFLGQTFRLIEWGDLPAIASAFTFGREGLLPDVFRRVVDELAPDDPARLSTFRGYLDRHIELDSDDHGPLAERLVSDLCGDDPDHWRSAGDAAVKALQARIALWDAIDDRIAAPAA